MKKLTKEELCKVQGGGITGTLINSITKGINLFVELGRAVGSGIRRITNNNMCGF